MILIVGLLKDIFTILAGVLSSYKTFLEIKKLKNSDKEEKVKNPDDKHQDSPKKS